VEFQLPAISQSLTEIEIPPALAAWSFSFSLQQHQQKLRYHLL